MNPIIRAIYSHIEFGNGPTSFVSAYPNDETRHGIVVDLSNNVQQKHEMHPQDHAQFLLWFKEAEDWWAKKQWEDIQRI